MPFLPHFLTWRGLNLDEVKSLLQKSIRRKDRQHAMQAVAELDKSLKEKHLVTYLLEDHALAGAEALREAVKVSKDGHRFVELLVDRVKPSRYAACMPVVVMSPEYELFSGLDVPDLADADLAESQWTFDTKKDDGCMDVGVALTIWRNGWRSLSEHGIMCGMKLLTVAIDHEPRRKVHFACSVDTRRRTALNLCQLALHTVLLEETEEEMKDALQSLIKLAAVPDVCYRLLLSVAATRKWQFHCRKVSCDVSVTETPVSAPYSWQWNDTQLFLIDMPSWAVDKHTKRGKIGVSTLPYYMNAPQGKRQLPTHLEEEFHAKRDRSGLKSFLSDGVKLVSEAVHNDMWEDTMKMYLKQSCLRHAKTVAMTAAYLKDTLKKHHRKLFHRTTPHASEDVSKATLVSDHRPVPSTSKKRPLQVPTSLNQRKKQKTMDECTRIREAPECENPLLQIPNGSNKTYTHLDMLRNVVIKGPYKKMATRDLVVRRHNLMRQVFGDKHTLPAEPHMNLCIVFPVVKNKVVVEYVTERRTYKDFVRGKDMYTAGQVVDVNSMGVRKLNKLSADEIQRLPKTVWLHFAYRYAANIGDSGLYNALFDGENVYGIDMDEQRRTPASGGIASMLFTRNPAAKLMAQIMQVLKENKDFFVATLKVKCTAEELVEFSDIVNIENVNEKLARLRQALIDM